MPRAFEHGIDFKPGPLKTEGSGTQNRLGFYVYATRPSMRRALILF